MTINNKMQLIMDVMAIDDFESGISEEGMHVINLYAEVAKEFGYQIKDLTEQIERLKNQNNKH